MAKQSTSSGGGSKSRSLFGSKSGSKNGYKEPKEPKVKKPRFARIRELWQAYKMLKPQDPRLPFWILLAAIGSAVVVYVVLTLLTTNFWFGIVPAILVAVLAGLVVFSFRARRTTFAKAEGQAGAASWAMKQMRGDWRITEAVASNSQSDLVHRVIGRAGIVLVAEGNPHRLKSLLSQEKRRLARVVGETPIYDVHVGNGEGEVPLKKLNNYIMKLPRNIEASQVRTLDKRLKAVGAPKMPVPHGPLPKGKQMAVNARQLRRRS